VVQTIAFYINYYAAVTHSRFLNQFPTLIRYKELLSKAIPYAGGTNRNNCFLNQLPTLEELPFESTPYAGGRLYLYTGGITLCWWYWRH